MKKKREGENEKEKRGRGRTKKMKGEILKMFNFYLTLNPTPT